MKTKSESRRQAILDEAERAFRERGFEGTSMSEIRARVGGSKATLYNYFASKDELFFEVMMRSREAEFETVHQCIDPNMASFADALQQFGERFLALLYSPDVRANRHLAIAVSGKSELGRLLYERGILRSQKLIAGFLQAAMEQGKLRPADPLLLARQLCALLEAELIAPFLFQQLAEVSADEIRAIAERAIVVFMTAYGPRDGQKR